jgi:hypothetical protein
MILARAVAERNIKSATGLRNKKNDVERENPAERPGFLLELDESYFPKRLKLFLRDFFSSGRPQADLAIIRISTAIDESSSAMGVAVASVLRAVE